MFTPSFLEATPARADTRFGFGIGVNKTEIVKRPDNELEGYYKYDLFGYLITGNVEFVNMSRLAIQGFAGITTDVREEAVSCTGFGVDFAYRVLGGPRRETKTFGESVLRDYHRFDVTLSVAPTVNRYGYPSRKEEVDDLSTQVLEFQVGFGVAYGIFREQAVQLQFLQSTRAFVISGDDVSTNGTTFIVGWQSPG